MGLVLADFLNILDNKIISHLFSVIFLIVLILISSLRSLHLTYRLAKRTVNYD